MFAGGTGWRWLRITSWHDPRGHVHSDMATYISLAKRLTTPGYVSTPADVLQPPGASLLFAWFYRYDPSFQSLVWFTGEPRFRIPFDGLFIILAIEFYRSLRHDPRGPVCPSRTVERGAKERA